MTFRTFRSREVIILLAFVFIQVIGQKCYKLKLLSFKTSDTKLLRLNITLFRNSSLTTLATVHKDIQIPMLRLKILEHARKSGLQKIHYNGLIRTCEFLNAIKKVKYIRDLILPLLLDRQKGNFTFQCPLRKGNYEIRDVNFAPTSGGVLNYLLAPNSIYSLSFKTFQRLSNKKMDLLCTVEFNSTIANIC